MTCYEKIIEMLPVEINDSIRHIFTLDDETLKRVNRLGKRECEKLSANLAFTMGVDDFEMRVIDFLNFVEKPKLDKKVKDLSIENMWDRWERGGRVSKKELSKIIGCSIDKIESYCSKSASVYLKSYSRGAGANVYFKKSDWEEYEPYLER